MRFLKSVILVLLFINYANVFAQNRSPKIDSIKKIYTSSKDISIVANASINLGRLYNNFNTDSAMYFFRNALSIATKNKLPKYQTRAYNNIAASFIMSGQLDSSEIYFNKAEKLLPTIEDYNAYVSYYGDRGILEYYKGDFKAAGMLFEKSLDVALKENNMDGIINASNNTALVLSKLGEDSKAIDIYYSALKAAEEQKDSGNIGRIKNNIANIYKNIGLKDKALELYEESLSVKLKSGSYIDIITGYFNIATLQVELSTINNDTTYITKAEKNYNTALKISTEKKYGNGRFLGLEGLGKIALERKQYEKGARYFKNILQLTSKEKNAPYENMALLSLGSIAISTEDYKKAEEYLFKAKEFVEESGTITQKKQLYNSLNLLYFNKKDYKNAHLYLLKQKEIEDKVVSEELKNKVSFYQVKYETEKKEKEIILQKEQLLESDLKIKNRNLYAILITSFLVIGGILSFGFYKKNQLKRKQLQKEIDLKDALATIKTQNKLQEQRLRISRDLHDNIGSQLTFIISSIDNLKYISKDANENLRSKLTNISTFTSDTIFQLRDTIWAMNKSEITVEDLHARILSFIEKAKTATSNTNFILNNSINSDIKFTSLVGVNVFRVVQEAINNAIKYANATEIKITLNEKNNQVSISIVDNGNGFDKNTVTFGNGLSNMEKRMSEVGGKVFIETTLKEGTKIEIHYTL